MPPSSGRGASAVAHDRPQGPAHAQARQPRGRSKGPVAPAPMTAAEARARRKSLAGPKLSREERRADRVGGAPRWRIGGSA